MTGLEKAHDPNRSNERATQWLITLFSLTRLRLCPTMTAFIKLTNLPSLHYPRPVQSDPATCTIGSATQTLLWKRKNFFINAKAHLNLDLLGFHFRHLPKHARSSCGSANPHGSMLGPCQQSIGKWQGRESGLSRDFLTLEEPRQSPHQG